MIKRFLLGFLLLISGFFFLFNKVKIVDSEDLAVYVDSKLQDSIPKKGEATFIKAVCDNNGKASWNNDSWGLFVSNMTKKTKCNLYFSSYVGDTIFNFDYTGSEQVFTVPVSGTYKLETWGAQGGSYLLKGCTGGYGAFSGGSISIEKGQLLYINVGGMGLGNSKHESILGGYNGGGNASITWDDHEITATGGGATHIAMKSGLLSTLENYKSNILIASGAGGGGGGNSVVMCTNGGSGGGYIGNSGENYIEGDQYNDNGYTYNSIGYGGTQNSGGLYKKSDATLDIFSQTGTFGQGASAVYGGGGGGYYGGGTSISSNGGGSGYIGNPLLKDKAMYCYNCEESSDESTKTISTTCSEETPTENCAKKGNGYARITLVSIDE